MVCVLLCEKYPKAQLKVVLEKAGIDVRPLVFKACDLSTTPRYVKIKSLITYNKIL